MTPTLTYFRDSNGQWWSFSINPDGSPDTIVTAPQGSTMPVPTFSYYQDSTGAWWEFSINSDGSAQTTAISAPAPGPTPGIVVNTQSTIRLLDTMEWAKKFIANRATAIGNYLEPALTSANIIKQTILGAPFRWRWNRTMTGFVTTPGQQDYYVFNWIANTPIEAGWVLVDINGNCQRAVNFGVTGTFYPSFNPTLNGITGDGTGSTTVDWINAGQINIEAGINYNFGWTETTSVQDANNKWWTMESKIGLDIDSIQARPRYISAQGDDGSGNIMFRVIPEPDQTYPVAITLQQNAGLFTSVYQTWNPIPDFYSDIYNWGFLAHMLLFSDDARFQWANSKFVTSLLSRNQGLTQSEINIWLANWQEITGQPISLSIANTQGSQARGV